MGLKCDIGHSLEPEGWSLESAIACPYCLYALNKDLGLVEAIPESDREVIRAALKRKADPGQEESCCR